MVILTCRDGSSAYQCRRCNHKEPIIPPPPISRKEEENATDTGPKSDPKACGRIVVLRRNYNAAPEGLTAVDDSALLDDPTYPLIHRECPRGGCESTKVTFTKIDSDKLLYRYTCSNGHSWSNELAGNKFRT